MDPISPIVLVVNALAAGAVAALKPMAGAAIKDAYKGIKRIIKDKYAKAQSSVEMLEANPESDRQKEVVNNELEQLDAASNTELVALAAKLLEAIRDEQPDALERTGIWLKDIEAGQNVHIEDLIAAGGILVERVKAEGNFEVKGVRSGYEGPGSSPLEKA